MGKLDAKLPSLQVVAKESAKASRRALPVKVRALYSLHETLKA